MSNLSEAGKSRVRPTRSLLSLWRAPQQVQMTKRAACRCRKGCNHHLELKEEPATDPEESKFTPYIVQAKVNLPIEVELWVNGKHLL